MGTGPTGDIDMGTHNSPATVAGTLHDYAIYERGMQHSPETIRVRLSFLRRWARHDDPTVTGYVRFIADHPHWSAQSRASAAGAVRSWLRWAHLTHPLPGRVIAHVDDIPYVRVTPRNTNRAAARDRILAALASCDETTALMMLLGREAGLRRAEIARVHSSDLLPDGRLVVHGKGDRDRTVPVSPMLAAALRTRPPGWVFPGRHDGHVAVSTVGRRISDALGSNAHSLRHAFAAAAYEASGHDIRCVQELLGHSTPATTQVYLGVSDERLRASVASASLAVR